MQNVQKWVSLSFLVVSVGAWMLLRELGELLLGVVPWRFSGEWIVSPQDLFGIFLALVLFVVLRKSSTSNEYTKEVILELSKVTWPIRKEAALSTVVVVVLVTLVSFILLGFDAIWGTLIGFLYQ